VGKIAVSGITLLMPAYAPFMPAYAGACRNRRRQLPANGNVIKLSSSSQDFRPETLAGVDLQRRKEFRAVQHDSAVSINIATLRRNNKQTSSSSAPH
jgi:hypothetical protein